MNDAIALIQAGTIPYGHALRLQERLWAARQREEISDTLLLLQHPPVITLGAAGGRKDLHVSIRHLKRLGFEFHETERGGRATYHGPGQLVAYPIMRLPDGDLHVYLWKLEEAVLKLLTDWDIAAGRVERHPGVWVGQDKIAAVGVAVRAGVTTHGLALNVNTDLTHFDLITPCGIQDRDMTSMEAMLGHAVPMAEVEKEFVRTFSAVFDRQVAPRRTPGEWLLVPAPDGKTDRVAGLLHELRLSTVCHAAGCPNIGECWARGTATFMILGDVCTRNCRFCAVTTGQGISPDPDEPERVAEAAARLGLQHVVVTSVTRDDLPDGGAGHFAATVRAVRERCPSATVELLVPDFDGRLAALEQIVGARPDVLNHNLETAPRLYTKVRPRASYRRSLGLLSWASNKGLVTKSGLMLGLGERHGEVLTVIRDLRRAGCDILTLGQYLQPTPHQLPVAEYITPAEFDWYREVGREMGFEAVVAGPLVRSSYRAGLETSGVFRTSEILLQN